MEEHFPIFPAGSKREPAPDAGRARSRLGGLVLVALGLVFVWQALHLPLGTPHRMGAGFFPLGVGIVVSVLGAALVIAAPPIPGPALITRWRTLVCVSAAILGFVLVIDRLGLIPAAFTAVLLASLSEDAPKPVGSALLALGVSVGAWLLFALALGLPFTAFGG